jgi:hypothetical protein
MDFNWIQYATNVAVVASSWIVGIVIARFIIRKWFGINPDGPEILNKGGGVSTDDVLDFDKSEMPYIPVKITQEHDLYYAWFKGNDKFIGQAETMDEIEIMTYRHLVKLVGLRLEFEQEKEKTASE